MVHIITKNEVNVLSYLFRHYYENLSINELAKKVNITAKGIYKILKKLEDDDLVVKEKVANAFIYKLNFTHPKTEDIVKYVLKSELAPNSYVKVLMKDLEMLKDCTEAMIVFGSVLAKGIKANDIDLMAIIDKKQYVKLSKKVKDFEKVSPKKIHLVVQTKQDLKENLQTEDKVIKGALSEGFILQGFSLLYEVVKNVAG